MHLSATGLLVGEDDVVPEPFEHPHGRLADLRVQRVGDASDEEGDLHAQPSAERAARAIAPSTPARSPSPGATISGAAT